MKICLLALVLVTAPMLAREARADERQPPESMAVTADAFLGAAAYANYGRQPSIGAELRARLRYVEAGALAMHDGVFGPETTTFGGLAGVNYSEIRHLELDGVAVAGVRQYHLGETIGVFAPGDPGFTTTTPFIGGIASARAVFGDTVRFVLGGSLLLTTDTSRDEVSYKDRKYAVGDAQAAVLLHLGVQVAK